MASTDDDSHKLNPVNNNLEEFRQLTGINSDQTLKQAANDKLAVFRRFIRIISAWRQNRASKKSSQAPNEQQPGSKPTEAPNEQQPGSKPTEALGRPASNVGIYARTVRAEHRAKRRYRIFSFLINACLGIQIIVAASLTALGAGNGPHRVVTGFGAINTIIAGFLTYLKGSGLPNRYKHQQNQWETVREYIEQRERDFYSKECALKVKDEIDIIECMYEDARSEESSVPNSYGSRKARGRKGENDDPEQGTKRTVN